MVARPDLVLRNGDRIEYALICNKMKWLTSTACSNTVHRHEPPVTNDPILILHIDREREFIVISKPGSLVSAYSESSSHLINGKQPVHAAGRYFKHTVLEMMESDYGLKCYCKPYFRASPE